MICNICLSDNATNKEDHVDLCVDCLKLVSVEKQNPRKCIPSD